jgi:hypothetical protein
MKLALFILSDPKAGDDALGRLFNGLAVAAEAQTAGDDVALVFSGAGTRWPEELARLGHPARALYESVRDSVRGASCACAEVFGAKESVESCDLPLLKHHELAGTSGMASVRSFIAEGYQTLIF